MMLFQLKALELVECLLLGCMLSLTG